MCLCRYSHLFGSIHAQAEFDSMPANASILRPFGEYCVLLLDVMEGEALCSVWTTFWKILCHPQLFSVTKLDQERFTAKQ